MTITGRKATLLVGALIASVCLNIAAGATWGARVAKGHPDRSHEFGVGRLIKSAPDEAQPTLHARFEEHRPELTDRILAVRAARRVVSMLLRNGPADAAALDAAFAELRRRSDDVQTLVHTALIEAAIDMPPDVRARWSESWGGRR
jgi:uncharacterized membrane protein